MREPNEFYILHKLTIKTQQWTPQGSRKRGRPQYLIWVFQYEVKRTHEFGIKTQQWNRKVGGEEETATFHLRIVGRVEEDRINHGTTK